MLILAIFNVMTGLVFAFVARERVRADGPFAPPALSLVALHAALVALVTAYFYAVHPAWSWMYAVDPAGVPALAVVPLMTGHVALVGAGWLMGRRLLRREPSNALRIALAVLGVGALVVIVLGRGRLAVSAGYHEFAAGGGRGLFDVALGYALIVAFLALGASVTYVIAELRVDRRRVRAR